MRLSSMTYSEGLDCDVLPLNMFFIWAYNNWHLNRFWRQKYLKQDQGRYFSSSLWKYSADQNQETGSSLSEITWTKKLWSIKLELAIPEKN